MSLSTSLLDELRRVVGRPGYLDQAADLEPYLVDHRQLYRGATPLVLRPDSTAQVSSIMRLCNEAGVGVVPVGGNTSYCGGATPSEDGSQIVLSLARMRRIRSIDPLNYTMIAEAGCVLAEVQAAAASVDRLFPMSLGSEGSCQLGGNLSTNAGGTAVLRYGMMRDLVLGLEVVLPDGRILDGLRPLRKDNTGYDLRDLFMGAEGTLGVITAAACKLFSRPAATVTALVGLTDPRHAVALLSRLRTFTGDAVSTFELIPRIALELVLEHVPNTADPLDRRHDWYVLVEIGMGRHAESLRDAIEAELAAAMTEGQITDAALATSHAQRDLFWRLRETIPEAQRRIGASIKHDVSVSSSELPQFIIEASRLVQQLCPQGRIVSYGHLGDGNLHFNVSRPSDGDDESFLRLAPDMNRAVHDLVARYGGSISAEHGIGRLKREELVRYKQPAALDVMRAIKQALDPNGIMNPGKVL
ncbi:MAG: FAD-binding oxidoreductase [Pseudomonadota bacterium]|nr:FAD-binding oxidoreductase [Pseudomonadota bacterium]